MSLSMGDVSHKTLLEGKWRIEHGLVWPSITECTAITDEISDCSAECGAECGAECKAEGIKENVT